MSKIKRFNEDPKEEVNIWCVIMHDHGGFIEEEHCKCFYNKMMAADYYIKMVNKSEDTEFEPFYESDTRLFTNTDENPDWEECLSYVEEWELKIDIVEIPLSKNSVK